MTKDNFGLSDFTKNILDDAEEEAEKWFDAEDLHEMLIYDLIGRLMNEAHRDQEYLKRDVCEMIDQHGWLSSQRVLACERDKNTLN